MITEAIILAGGLGTRLKGVIDDIPKPMAPILDTPFLQYIFEYLISYKVEHAVLAVGYRHEVIKDHFGNKYKSLNLSYAIEATPLGTGGGIANAISQIKTNECFLLNGDTFFNVNLEQLSNTHFESNADLTLSLKEMTNFNRYGSVQFDKKKRIINFIEKKPLEHGYINGGIYALHKSIFNTFKSGQKFSFEQDIMEAKISKLTMQAYLCSDYFIDIGIPEDYKRATAELPAMFGF